jgi:DNA polymerase I
MNLFLDIETDSTASNIWICYTYNQETKEYQCHTAADTLNPLIEKADKVIAHNLIGFDRPVLERLWKTKICSSKVTDTLILSRLWQPSIENGHGLDAWGKRLGKTKKADYQRLYWRLQGVRKFDAKDKSHWDKPHTDLLKAYCKRDVKVLVDVYNHLQEETKGWGDSIDLEHQVALIIQEQIEHGFKFDEQHATALQAQLAGEVADIEAQLQVVFPPIVEKRVSEKTGKELKDRVISFNPGSRQQIADRLQGLGVKFTKTTEKGSIIVDEKVLEGIDLPEAKLIARYLMLQKRVSQINSWFEELKPDGRVHGRVITNGAVTGRMTHASPNMAQVPNSGSEYGPECRQCFIVDKGHVLVGADASGLELRMLAHYMEDEAYVTTVVEGSSKDGTDVHTKNQKAAGLPTRDHAKTFIYAFLYGAGAAKIGSIVGKGSAEGQRLMARFLKATPALQKLRDKVAKQASKGYVQGLDGRKIWVRSEHAALNSLLQGAGAIVMKKALVLLDRRLKRNGVQYGFCANVHDEWQIETEAKYAEFVGESAVWAIRLAGRKLGLTCPLDGEYKIGKSWRETH